MALDNFQTEVAAVCLKKMLNSSFFSISEVDKIAKMAGVSACQYEDYAALNSLHCVHWSDMPTGMVKEVKLRTLTLVQAMLKDEIEVVFNRPNDNSAIQLVSRLEEDTKTKPKGWLGRLSWGKS